MLWPHLSQENFDDRIEITILGIRRDPKGSREFDGGNTIAREAKHGLKTGLPGASGKIADTEVIHQQLHPGLPRDRGDIGPLIVVGEHLGIQAERAQSLQQAQTLRPGERIAVVADQIEAHTDQPRGDQDLQLLVRDGVVNNTDGPEPMRMALHRIDQDRIVRSIAAQLYEQGAMHAMPIENVDVLLARARLVGLRLVALVAGQRKAHRIDDVRVAVEDAGGHST